jgi:predicted RNase H-like HicB family nuclease
MPSIAPGADDFAEALERLYPVTLRPQSEGGFVAEVEDLPGCITQGETAAEALANADDARRLWLAAARAHGDPIPPPSIDQRYGGRLLVRMPRSLHRRLAERARREGVSLNQYVVALLAEGSAPQTR